jgi:hypothetical protein
MRETGEQTAGRAHDPHTTAGVHTRLWRPGADAEALAKGIALLRIGIGLTALAAPAVMAGPWIGTEAKQPQAQLLARAMGMRDVALGAGALLACAQGEDARDWVRMGALSDAMDATLTCAAFARLPKLGRWGVLASAGGAAVAGLWAASRMG